MALKKVGVALIVFVITIFIGGVFYSLIEGWSFLDSLYFSAVTITTLGYGDFVPTTDFGKLFTIVFSLSGIAISLYILTMLGKSFFDIELRRRGAPKATLLREGKEFDVTKIEIGQTIDWRSGKKESQEGDVVEIGLNYIRVHIDRKSGNLLPKKDQKTVKISSKGKLKKE